MLDKELIIRHYYSQLRLRLEQGLTESIIINGFGTFSVSEARVAREIKKELKRKVPNYSLINKWCLILLERESKGLINKTSEAKYVTSLSTFLHHFRRFPIESYVIIEYANNYCGTNLRQAIFKLYYTALTNNNTQNPTIKLLQDEKERFEHSKKN